MKNNNFNKVFFILSLLFFNYFNSQKVKLENDTINGNVLSIEMDSRISDLLDEAKENCKTNIFENNNAKLKNKTTPQEITVKKPLSQYEICKQNPRMSGFKIQVTLAKSAEEAQKIRQYIRNRLPNLKVEIDGSLRPNYKILAGSYFTRESAAADIRAIKAYFERPIAVPWRVFCVESK